MICPLLDHYSTNTMDSRELKFVLKLLAAPDYRAAIATIKPNLRTKASERDSLCRVLRDRGLVDCDEQVTRFRLAPAGRALLKLDTQRLPVSEDEILLLQAASLGSAEVKAVALTGDRLQAAIERAIGRGFIKAEKTMIETVWLTQRGLDYLREEFSPSGTALELSLDHLADYLRFLRKFQTQAPQAIADRATVSPAQSSPRNPTLTHDPQTESPASSIAHVSRDQVSGDQDSVSPIQSPPSSTPNSPRPSAQDSPPELTANLENTTLQAPITGDRLYDLIAQLDRQHNTHNYLPIYYLRDRLQPMMDREVVDRALYALQRADRLELSSLQEAAHYTAEEINAGIPQDIGGPLFFLIRT